MLLHGANNVMRMSSLVRWRGCWSRRLGGDPPVAGSLGDRAGGTDPQLVWPGCGRRWSLGAPLQRERLKRHAKLRCGSGRGTSAVILWLHHQRGGKRPANGLIPRGRSTSATPFGTGRCCCARYRQDGRGERDCLPPQPQVHTDLLLINAGRLRR